MKQKLLFWSVFFTAQPILAQKDLVRILKKGEGIPCFSQCSDPKRMKTSQDTLCCEALVSIITIEQIQQGLKRQGFSLKVNGQFDRKTKKAWIAFQREKGFPPHSNLELFQALGILKQIE